MVCGRCITAVENLMNELQLKPASVELGEVKLASGPYQLNQIQEALLPWGFSLVNAKELELCSKIRELIAEVYSSKFEFPENFSLSAYLSKQLGERYENLSKIFSAHEDLSIEQYAIHYRIEKAKELLHAGFTLSEISFMLGYSSIAHLSKQFAQKTGMNPSAFKK